MADTWIFPGGGKYTMPPVLGKRDLRRANLCEGVADGTGCQTEVLAGIVKAAGKYAVVVAMSV